MKKIISLVFICVLSVTSSFAKDQKFALDKVTYEGISKVQVHIQKEEFKEAKELLLSLEASKKIRKKQGKAYVRFFMGYFYSLQENNVLALKYYKKALTYEALPKAQLSNTYLNIIQIVMDAQKYEETLVYLDKLIALTTPPKPEYFVYQANAHLALQNYAKVITSLDKAISVSKKTKTNWIKTKFYAHYMLKEYSNAVDMLKLLIQREPKSKEYWIQLSSLYVVDEHLNKALCALDISRLAKAELSENEWLQLISWLRFQNIPYKAAFLMQEGIDNKVISSSEKHLDTLGDMYYESKEYTQALHWYDKAANLSKNGNIYFKIAQIQSNNRHYLKAVDAIKHSLNKKDKEKVGAKYLLMAKAYYELNNIEQAKAGFSKALKYKKSKKTAQIWLDYINKV
ncbi:hypothetical protein JHD50_01710 [Sulfurimonas sp. MAG313]|nr:hypothetical protein [Sulfurimonas sp. MAG313]MDF1880026.1 hypothetical protein [Sulfurimonas sp. MAG313]